MTKAFSNGKYAIVGAGLMGRLLAVALAKRGAQVELFEKGGSDAANAAARIAAAMLAPLAESAITEDNVVRMGVHSLPRWKQLIDELAKPVYFQQDGTLILWHRQDASDAERFASHLERNCDRNQALSKPIHLDSQSLAEIEPGVADRFTQGLYLPNEGQLDNRQLLEALLVEFTLMKVPCHWNQSIDPEQLRNSEHGFDWVIDCRGLGAKDSWKQLGDTSKDLRGVRGEVIRLYAPEVKLRRPTRLIHPRYPIYIAPKEDDVYVVGATEIESEDLSPMSVRSAMELLSAVYTVHSGFAEARILEMATQCRPTLKDNLPEIFVDQKSNQADLMMINGLYRHGFMISPAILDCALEVLSSGSSSTAIELGLEVTGSTHQELSACA
ncbi:MAG: glycine oxidase [Polynucleobacter sp. 24-46-87]|uniref:FAD-dependent oxidoreductase n=1 Tax=Polynucleobacter sp. 39-46-10 TaxID=1970428 RepID=UPI000BDAC154|nr:FAD-dependent oxidoreductase [Polynucleobacter sp. 39-46-10]OZA14013.1 MAG: glycine oxidase [Polynucleobacter sp. 24-46-87]OZA77715.1 MAG: glycine oxidase [Polynucleobacter sp. 39-46-10]